MDEKIDINRADVERLASLPGIGPWRAAKIVAYRNDVHPFEEIIELAAVPGISERMVRDISDLITVNGTADEEAAVIEDVGLPVEEIAFLTAGTGNGSGEGDEVEEAAAGVGGERPVEAEEEEPPVVVTFLESEEVGTESEPAVAAEPTIAPEVIERRVVETIQRRHVHWGQQLLGVTIGAVLGSLMTLVLLFLLNGTLRFAGESRTADLQLQLDEQTSASQQAQRSMADEIGALAGQVAELDNDLAASGEAIGAVEADVIELEEETAAINEQLAAVNLAAEKFDSFMNGLRDLLVALQGLPPVITDTTTLSGTATVTGTLMPETADLTITPTPELSPAGQTPEGAAPTRTPRPTATPLIEGGG